MHSLILLLVLTSFYILSEIAGPRGGKPVRALVAVRARGRRR